MARAAWTWTISSAPARAPADYRSLPPCVRLDKGTWYNGLWHECRACGKYSAYNGYD